MQRERVGHRPCGRHLLRGSQVAAVVEPDMELDLLRKKPRVKAGLLGELTQGRVERGSSRPGVHRSPAGASLSWKPPGDAHLPAFGDAFAVGAADQQHLPPAVPVAGDDQVDGRVAAGAHRMAAPDRAAARRR